MPTLFDERFERDLADDLRRSVAEVEFDYPALVAGVRRRVARLRRRRIPETGSSVLLLAPRWWVGARWSCRGYPTHRRD
ncbi:hypothetical protein MWU75_01190 [Ornithinimicrobium sp. F0845]|uniref:hypothetical protein n=1 Tax=Ornithinimicrobium sp. F0845 TaxID=2926412 RepID=UPI001FF27A26|nr:hypothetical protein [Ornithinimicrobium sp. F0845]MCK0110757.1 hypothetical protein [Ornithinimicrobium sp. F0845]